jgi:predicted RNase H-like HicB family nuclease
MEYIAVIHKDKDSDYGVSFPDLPGCISAGETLEEARWMAREAAEFHLDSIIEDGEDVPIPTTLDEIAANPEYTDAALYMAVPVTLPGKAVRVTITANERVLSIIDTLAKRYGFNRSAFLMQGAMELGNRLRGR